MVIPEQGVARGRSSESLMRVSDSRLWGPALLCSDFKGSLRMCGRFTYHSHAGISRPVFSRNSTLNQTPVKGQSRFLPWRAGPAPSPLDLLGWQEGRAGD